MSEDGARIFTKCGDVFRSTEGQAEDMTFAGSFGAMMSIAHLSHSALANEVAVIREPDRCGTGAEDTRVGVYSYELLNVSRTIDLPISESPRGQVIWHGRWVFFSADGTKLYVIAQADPIAASLHDFTIFSF
jgi:hypothetical protein